MLQTSSEGEEDLMVSASLLSCSKALQRASYKFCYLLCIDSVFFSLCYKLFSEQQSNSCKLSAHDNLSQLFQLSQLTLL